MVIEQVLVYFTPAVLKVSVPTRAGPDIRDTHTRIKLYREAIIMIIYYFI